MHRLLLVTILTVSIQQNSVGASTTCDLRSIFRTPTSRRNYDQLELLERSNFPDMDQSETSTSDDDKGRSVANAQIMVRFGESGDENKDKCNCGKCQCCQPYYPPYWHPFFGGIPPFYDPEWRRILADSIIYGPGCAGAKHQEAVLPPIKKPTKVLPIEEKETEVVGGQETTTVPIDLMDWISNTIAPTTEESTTTFKTKKLGITGGVSAQSAYLIDETTVGTTLEPEIDEVTSTVTNTEILTQKIPEIHIDHEKLDKFRKNSPPLQFREVAVPEDTTKPLENSLVTYISPKPNTPPKKIVTYPVFKEKEEPCYQPQPYYNPIIPLQTYQPYFYQNQFISQLAPYQLTYPQPQASQQYNNYGTNYKQPISDGSLNQQLSNPPKQQCEGCCCSCCTKYTKELNE